jgi:hypothetical protein
MTRSLHLRQVIGPVLGLAGFALALVATSTAAAQDGAAPAPTAAPTTAPAPAETTAPTTAPTPAPTAAEDEEAKKKKAAADAAAAGSSPATTEGKGTSTAGPTTTSATPTGGDASTTVTFGSGPKKDEPSKGAAAKPEAAPPIPWYRGSLFIFDQSMSANTFKKDAQLSYQPSYEWWLSPRVNYNFSKEFRVTVRQDVFKEWTNVGETTKRNEWMYSDTWVSLAYRPSLASISKNLTGGVGLQLRPGISRESRIAGQYFAAGPLVNVNYNIPLGGEKAKFFQSMHVGSAAVYTYAFSRCTGPCASESSDFSQRRMNTEGQVIDDRQARTNSMIGNQLLYTANLGLDIYEHLDWSASMIWISQFTKGTPDANFDGQEVERNANQTNLRQFSWFFTQFSYGISKEFTVAAGYWNFNRTTGLDGKYRNPFWSPDTRVFFDVYFHLDAIYEKVLGGEQKKSTGPGGGSSRVF